MNITTNYPNISLVTTNPATDRAVQDNAARPIIPAAESVAPNLKQQSVAGQRDKAVPNGVAATNASYDLPANASAEELEQAREHQDNRGEEHQDAKKNSQQSSEEQDKSPANGDKPEARYSESEQQKIAELSKRDREVVAHEMAHATAGGQYSGAPSYSYQTGPDGAKYAVSGEVAIDTSRVANDPQATLRKAQQIKAAALAPVQPSSQDRRVAMKADMMAAEARQQILAQGRGEESADRVSDEVDSESFRHSADLAQDEQLQATLTRRSDHINAFYNGSAEVAPAAILSHQV